MTKKILIIEDSPTQLGFTNAILEEDGFEVDIAMSGEEGLEKARAMKPDLILLDLVLPGIDGLEVCAQIKQEVSLSHTIVIVLSVKDKVEEITKAFRAGADDYIIKPPIPELLSNKVKLYLGIK